MTKNEVFNLAAFLDWMENIKIQGVVGTKRVGARAPLSHS